MPNVSGASDQELTLAQQLIENKALPLSCSATDRNNSNRSLHLQVFFFTELDVDHVAQVGLIILLPVMHALK